MASMRTVSCTIDPTKPAKYPIVLSQALLDGRERVTQQHAVIQCMTDSFPEWISSTLTGVVMSVNHKPDLSSSRAEARIAPSPSSGPNKYNLTIKADESGSNYFYSGTQKPSESYALIYNPINQTFTLDRVKSDFTFNLRSTPTVKSSKSLAALYPHLSVDISDSELSSEDIAQENDSDASGADPNNPYDYRHFIKSRCTSSSVTPDLPAVTPASSPRRTVPRSKLPPRPVRPQPTRAPSPPPREETDADNEDSDDGGLIIEIEPSTRKPRPLALGLDLKNGPISLRSAASSLSPTTIVDEEDDKMQVEEPKPKVNGFAEHSQDHEEEEEEGSEEEEEEEDESEEGVEGNGQAESNNQNQDEDDGSLEAELEEALQSQADEDNNSAMQHNTVPGVVVNGTFRGRVRNLLNEIGYRPGSGPNLGLGIPGLGVTPGPGPVHTGGDGHPVHDVSSSESEEE